MFAMRTEPDDVQRMPEQRLWTAVLARTVEEWISEPLRSRKEAEAFLFEDETDFRAVCHAVGRDPARRSLQRSASFHDSSKVGTNPGQSAHCPVSVRYTTFLTGQGEEKTTEWASKLSRVSATRWTQ